MRRTILALCTAAAVCAPASVAAASTVVEDPSPDVRTGCLGTRHSPAFGYPDSFSTLLVALVLRDTIEALTVALTSTDGSGATTTAEVPVEDGVVETELPLVAYGPGTLTAEADGESLDLGSLSTYEIGDPEPPCSSTLFPAGFEPEPEPIPDPEPLREPGEPEATSPTEVAIDPEPTGVADGPGLLPWVLIGLGAVGAGVGGTRTRRRRGAGTGTRDGEDEEDDEDPRDAPPPVLYGEEIDLKYGTRVELVVKGDFRDLAADGNELMTLLEHPPGTVCVGVHYVAVTSTAVHDDVQRDARSFQVRQQGEHGRNGIAVPAWVTVDAERAGTIDTTGGEVFVRADVDVNRAGHRSGLLSSMHSGLSPAEGIPTMKTSKAAAVTSTSTLRESTTIAIQFEPTGPAADAGVTGANVFDAEGTSRLTLDVMTECDRCEGASDDVRSTCNPHYAVEASGGYEVEAQSDPSATMFSYTNAVTDTKVASSGKGGEGTNVVASGPKASVSLPNTPITLTEFSLAISPATGHVARGRSGPTTTGDRLLHHTADRMSVSLRSSASSTATIGVRPDQDGGVFVSAHRSTGRVQVEHDVWLRGDLTDEFCRRWKVGQQVVVFVGGTSRQGGVSVQVDARERTLERPTSATRGDTEWWRPG